MKKTLFVLALAATAALQAAELKDLHLKAKTDKPNPIDYRVGEEIRFDFFLDGVDAIPEGVKTPLYVIWTREADDGVKTKGTNAISLAQGFPVKTSLAVPGIVKLTAQLVDADYRIFKEVGASQWEKGIRFDGGAGVETEKLEMTTVEPKDFDAFWREAKAELAKVPLKPELIEVTPEKLKGKTKVFAVKVPSVPGSAPVTGFLSIPDGAKPGSLVAECQFDGYNGNRFGLPKPPEWNVNRIFFHVNAHGYEVTGHDAKYYKDFGNRVNGIGEGLPKRSTYALEPSDYRDPKTTYFYYMALRVVRAFDFVKSLPEWNGKDLVAQGGSQGGLQTMWAAGLVDGLTIAKPSITWGCDLGNSRNPAGSKFLSNGWGIPHEPGAFYFDAALHAKRVPKTCTVEITRLGMGDYTCPPRGVLLSYYNMKCPVKANLVQGSTHGFVPKAPNQTFTISKPAK